MEEKNEQITIKPKINIEVKKINKKSRAIEWTDTLEIPYEKPEKISIEEKEQIKEQYHRKEEIISKESNNDPMINSFILKMDSNPFYQPTMNTLEFDGEESKLVIDITKESEEELTENEKEQVLEKLVENKIVSREDTKNKNKWTWIVEKIKKTFSPK